MEFPSARLNYALPIEAPIALIPLVPPGEEALRGKVLLRQGRTGKRRAIRIWEGGFLASLAPCE